MKFQKINKFLAALVVSSLVSVATVKGATINGDIHFKNGAATLDVAGGSATSITNFTGVLTQQNTSTGDYASVTDGTSVTVQDLVFSYVGWTGIKIIANFWTFADAGVTYSFDMASITSSAWNGSALTITGTGTANSSAFASYAGTFQLSTSGNGTNISFSSVTSVPDSGTTTALLGLSMLGLAGAARRLRK